MRSLLITSMFLLFLPMGCTSTGSPSHQGKVNWIRTWSPEVFVKARAEKKLVLLDLGANWCHWCHVMEKKTYRHPEVIALLNHHFISVEVDQDGRPDLAHRYQNYGWPATIIFDSRGRELAKEQGYIRAPKMVALLKNLVADPTPRKPTEKKTTYSSTPYMSRDFQKELWEGFRNFYDHKNGGWSRGHKFLDWDSVEYCMVRARQGDREAEKMAKETLEKNLNLIDPIWGGVYQYSTGGKWTNIHYEKIMSFQAENMQIYAMAYLQWADEKHLKAALDIYRYLRAFLTSPDGAFYTSQDADLVKGVHSGEYYALPDQKRRAKGIPSVDKNIYSRENGWAIRALTYLYSATGKKKYLDEAVTAARWIIQHRSLPGGGFAHGAKDPAGPYLGDTLAMGRAFLALYTVTADKKWLARAELATQFIAKTFAYRPEKGPPVGILTTPIPERATGVFRRPDFQLEENINVARLANLLSHYTGKNVYRTLAHQALRYLVTPEVARRRWCAGILMVHREVTTSPLHITIVGAKKNGRARELFLQALQTPHGYRQIDWIEGGKGPIRLGDIEFPRLSVPAAYICTDNTCSTPLKTVHELIQFLAR